MSATRKWFIAALTLLTLVALGVGTALATSDSRAINEHAEVEDDEGNASAVESAEDTAEGEDTPIPDEETLKKASEIALAWLESEHGATGVVSDTEVGDEESYYEVEVTLDGGRQVDIQLTEGFKVVGLD